MRIGSLYSFHDGVTKQIVWLQCMTSESNNQVRWLRVILAKLSTPYEHPEYCNLAFIHANHYGPAQPTDEYRIAGSHGTGYNWLYHKFRSMRAKNVNPVYCDQYYEGISGLMDLGVILDGKQILFCMVDANCRQSKTGPCEPYRYPQMYDDGSGVFVEHRNVVMGLLLTRFHTKKDIGLPVATYVQRFHRGILMHVRRRSENFYRRFPENVSQYRKKKK